MSNFSQFASNNNTFPTNLEMVTSSSVYTCTRAGWYAFMAVGGGGGGGAAVLYAACGGGAGGFSVKRVYMPANTSVTITIGAGGVTSVACNAINNLQGASGSPTTVIGPGVSITANGGGGGGSRSAAGFTTGGIGGAATGGDINVTGGRGGNSDRQLFQAASAATGGGAVGIYGTGYAGGDHFDTNGITAIATGGAGVGGSGGSMLYVNTSALSSGGGGAGGPAVDINYDKSISTGVSVYNGFLGGPGGSMATGPYGLNPNGAGSPGQHVTTGSLINPILNTPYQTSSGGAIGYWPGPGGGGGGYQITPSDTPWSVTAGIFAGGGGFTPGASTRRCVGGTGGLGGGGGGALCQGGTGAAQGGPGGNGVVIVSYLG